jgi:hypothetical protein
MGLTASENALRVAAPRCRPPLAAPLLLFLLFLAALLVLPRLSLFRSSRRRPSLPPPELNNQTYIKINLYSEQQATIQ